MSSDDASRPSTVQRQTTFVPNTTYVVAAANTNEPQLMRQLQMRLQYARLKVERGWVSPQFVPCMCGLLNEMNAATPKSQRGREPVLPPFILLILQPQTDLTRIRSTRRHGRNVPTGELYPSRDTPQ